MSSKPNIKNDLYIIGLLVLLLISAFAYSRAGQSNPTGAHDHDHLAERRFASAMQSWRYNGTSFPSFSCTDAISDRSAALKLEERTLLLHMGGAGCNSCQLRELRNLDSLFVASDRQLQVWAVYFNDTYPDLEQKRQETLMIRRASQAQFSFCYTEDPRYSDYMLGSPTPMMFVVERGMVLSSFAPIPDDDDFSSLYMQALKRLFIEPLPAPNLALDELSRAQIDKQWEIKRVDGEILRFEDLPGKTKLINFWATWCAPCIHELPTLQALYEDLKDELEVVLVSSESEEVVRRFIERRGYTLPVYTTEAAFIPKVFAVDNIPITYLANSDGTILYEHAGAANWNHGKVKEVIQQRITTAHE